MTPNSNRSSKTPEAFQLNWKGQGGLRTPQGRLRIPQDGLRRSQGRVRNPQDGLRIPQGGSEPPKAGSEPPGQGQKAPGWLRTPQGRARRPQGREQQGKQALLGAGGTYRDEVGPREVTDDAGRGADAHVADDGEQPPAKQHGVCPCPAHGEPGTHGWDGGLWEPQPGKGWKGHREQPRLHWLEGGERTVHPTAPCTQPRQGRNSPIHPQTPLCSQAQRSDPGGAAASR